MTQQQPEYTLYTQIEACIKMAAQLSAMNFDHQHVPTVTSRQGFPPSPEKFGPNVITDNFVLMSDSFQDCLKHLSEARKSLLMIGVQFAPKPMDDYEKSIPTQESNLRQ